MSFLDVSGMSISAVHSFDHTHNLFQSLGAQGDVGTYLSGQDSMAARFHDFMEQSHKASQSTLQNNVTSLYDKKEMTYEDALRASKDVFRNFYQQILKMIFNEIRKDEGREGNDYQSHMMGDLFVERLSDVLGNRETSDHHRMAEAMMKKERTLKDDSPFVQ